MIVHGEYPTNDIDHINGNPSDNNISNLRHVTREVNMQNQRKPRSNNPTGFLGVVKRRDGFISSITLRKKQRYLGTFATPELAHLAYVEAKRKLHDGCTL